MSSYVREFVKEQLETRGYHLPDDQVDRLVCWFDHWFEDSYDAISDAIDSAFRDCDIPPVVDDTDWEDEYTPSCTAGDYSPGNPWDAPGMSIQDFI